MSKHSIVRVGPGASLKGKVVHTRGGQKPVHAFLGIPFARPPVGRLRFRAPQPTPLWSGTRDALDYGAVCPQPFGSIQARMLGASVAPPKMDEDCLFLNVWTPNPSPEAKLPVMVWLYGGGFVYGFSNLFDGTAYADKQDVVFVSLNYRLGIFGFMCLEEESAPGNMGLLDQAMALRWIQTNIQAFGGDPGNVTLFGESAGGISTSFHTISRQSQGLFHKIICQSGVCLSDFFFWPPQNARKYVTKRLQALGCQATSAGEIISWLRTQDVQHLVDNMGEGFFPVKDDYFITEHPLKVYGRGDFQQVPAIIGFTSHEGTMFVFGQDMTKKALSSFEEAQMLAQMMITNNILRGKKNAHKVFEAAWALYVGQERDINKISAAVIDMIGDAIFVVPSIAAADLHSAQCPTYAYQFRHRSFRSQWPQWIEADHGDEVELVMGMPFMKVFPDNWPEEEKQLSHQLMTYWATFARTGDPNCAGLPRWPKYDEDRNILALSGTPGRTASLNLEKIHFWTDTLPKILHEGSESSKL